MIKIFKYLNKKQVWQIFLSLILIVGTVYLDLKILTTCQKLPCMSKALAIVWEIS